LTRTLVLAALLPAAVFAQAPKPSPDTLVFINGESLTGDLEKADAAGITFKSPMAGEITVGWANIKELKSDKKFAVLPKSAKLTRKDALTTVPQGTLEVADKQIKVGEKTVEVADTALVIEGVSFAKEVNAPESLLHGWSGAAEAGVSLVRATENSTSFNGSIHLEQSNPGVGWLPARDRTLFGFSQEYGSTGQVLETPVETNIFHALGERDEYVTPRAFVFGAATFDHNYSQTLSLGQSYGGGAGITVLKGPKQQLDVKVDVHYLKETFFFNPSSQTTAPSVSALASTFSETYLRKLPKGLVFNEFGSAAPAWANESNFTAHVNASLGFPLFKEIGFNVTAADDFLNNAPADTEKNSIQFTTGITYTIKPR
jgi:hypothetical protein